MLCLVRYPFPSDFYFFFFFLQQVFPHVYLVKLVFIKQQKKTTTSNNSENQIKQDLLPTFPVASALHGWNGSVGRERRLEGTSQFPVRCQLV